LLFARRPFLISFLRGIKKLYDSGRGWIDSKKCSSNRMYESVALQQESAVGNLLKKRGVVVSGSVLSPLSESPFPSALAGTSTSISVRGGKQNSFAFSSQRTMSTMNLDIRKSNYATVEMATADFFHCKNIPDAVVELSRFIRLVCMCHLVREDFIVPNQKQIGGDLLDLNYANVYEQNKADLLKFAKVFGLAFLGDGATIHQMALMIILAMSAAFPPMTISIQDCTKHMAEGGKKDALYIADLLTRR
jgi:hypothetical protein